MYSLSTLSGITPAYAGKSGYGGYWCNRCGDHPRLCGEKINLTNDETITEGSPPPMRGKAFSSPRDQYIFRITPAYAGKSPKQFSGILHFQDHPRLCGEKFSLWSVQFFPIGSPPPMRGKATIIQSVISAIGITPAYAGKSVHFIQIDNHYKDHPRLCGEKLYLS